MLNALFLSLAQTRLFWKTRNALSRFGFFCYRTLFGTKHRVREGSTTTKSVLSLLRIILGQLVLAIFITIILQITNSYFDILFTKIGFTIILEMNSYRTLLEAVIGVGGVFIGLYYAAIGTIGSAIYARVANNIRDLLAQEQIGNTYMRMLALLTSFGVCLLAFHTAGFDPIILAIPLLILGAGVMIIGFVRLGARAFYFFDPTLLSDRLFKQLRQCYLQVQAGGYQWSDQSFQNHAHGRAQDAIDTLADVAEIAAKEPYLNSKPFADLCKNLILFLCNYEIVKKSIPTNSLWYKKRNVHLNWYRTGDTETSLAYETASGLQPEVVRDSRWIESSILPIVKGCLEINIKEKRYAVANELLGYLDVYVQQLAAEHQVEYAFNLIGDVFSWCERLILTEVDNLVAEEPLEHMGICDQLATMPINALLAYTGAIESYGQDKIRQRIRHITWKSENSIYVAGFAVHILPRLEWMRPKLEFEEKIEWDIISPSWYLQELIAQQEAENLRTATICFFEKACGLYKQWIETATSSQHPWLKAIIISRESEYWNKLNYQMNILNQLWSDLNSSQRIEGLPWPSLDTDELTEKWKRREEELLDLMSAENILLSLMSRPESYPDFAGQFLHTVGEALLTAMCENDCSRVETLFKRYFGGSFLQFDRLHAEQMETDWQTLNNLKIAAAPLLDLMDISGYAYLLSDYHDTPRLKEPIVKAWDKYLSEESESQRLQSLAAAVSLTESAFEIAHRGINRTRWNQIIQRLLRNVEQQEIPPDPNMRVILPEFETVPIHESALVRVFARKLDYLFYDGIDIFLAKYVRQRESGKNLDFGSHRSRDLEEEIRNEENRDARNEEL